MQKLDAGQITVPLDLFLKLAQVGFTQKLISPVERNTLVERVRSDNPDASLPHWFITAEKEEVDHQKRMEDLKEHYTSMIGIPLYLHSVDNRYTPCVINKVHLTNFGSRVILRIYKKSCADKGMHPTELLRGDKTSFSKDLPEGGIVID